MTHGIINQRKRQSNKFTVPLKTSTDEFPSPPYSLFLGVFLNKTNMDGSSRDLGEGGRPSLCPVERLIHEPLSKEQVLASFPSAVITHAIQSGICTI